MDGMPGIWVQYNSATRRINHVNSRDVLSKLPLVPNGLPVRQIRDMTAWFNGFLGLLVSYWLGTRYLHMSLGQVLRCVGASNLAGFVAMITILQAERVPHLKKGLLRGVFRTWIFFSSLYFGTLLLCAPPLREGMRFIILIVPLILSTGFVIIISGPILDALTIRNQRRQKAQESI